jgi:hypothetical protein
MEWGLKQTLDRQRNASAASGPGKPVRCRLRETSLRDHEQIAALEGRYGLPSKSYDDWSHIWLGNPVYRELQPGWPIGWVLENEDKQIVGSMGNIPFRYELDGKAFLVASGSNWVADIAYRGPALQLLNNVIDAPRVDLYLNNTVNTNSTPVIAALGCSRVPAGVWDEVAYWITDYRRFFQSIAAMKNYRLGKPFSYPTWGGSWTRSKAVRARFSRPLSYPLSAAAFLKDRLTKASFRENDVEVRACPGFDERFDLFWENVRSNNRHVLLAVRTREVLEWHYRRYLRANRLWIAVVADGARLAAYALFEKIDSNRARLIDYAALDGGPSMLGPLLSWAMKKCRSEGVQSLEHTGRWLEKGELLDAASPYRRKAPGWAYYYRANNPELKTLLEDRQVWAPSLFDSEATL